MLKQFELLDIEIEEVDLDLSSELLPEYADGKESRVEKIQRRCYNKVK